jgi:hypothetical protein
LSGVEESRQESATEPRVRRTVSKADARRLREPDWLAAKVSGNSPPLSSSPLCVPLSCARVLCGPVNRPPVARCLCSADLLTFFAVLSSCQLCAASCCHATKQHRGLHTRRSSGVLFGPSNSRGRYAFPCAVGSGRSAVSRRPSVPLPFRFPHPSSYRPAEGGSLNTLLPYPPSSRENGVCDIRPRGGASIRPPSIAAHDDHCSSAAASTTASTRREKPR